MSRSLVKLARLAVFWFLATILGCASGGSLNGDHGAIAPDSALQDVNPGSSSYGQSVSPRDFLQKVSAWYFGHST